MIYLDNNSTTQPLELALVAQQDHFRDSWGNPSSDHQIGSQARLKILQVKETLAEHLGTGSPESIGFTSGGSEANHIVIKHLLSKAKVVGHSTIEHSSVIEAYERESISQKVLRLPVHNCGTLNLKELESSLRDENLGAISVQWANSESGSVQPIKEIIELCRKYNALLHVDAAQAAGRVKLAPSLLLDIDFLTFTAHKLHSLKGLGVIHCGEKQQDFDNLFPNAHTLNTPGIFALGAVASLISNPPTKELATLRNLFEEKLLKRHKELTINCVKETRLPNTTNIAFKGVDGAALVALLDQHDLVCSQLSACLIGRPEPSYVLTAMGYDEDHSRSSIRFSFSHLNTVEEVNQAVDIVTQCYSTLLTRTQLLAS